MISPNDTILIAGDSWGCGEWSKDDNPYRITHRGLAQYLIAYGCNAINISIPGGSNKETARILQTTTKIYDPQFVFWFQTDPMRDLRPYKQKTFPTSSKSLLDVSCQLLSNTYAELDSIGIKIHCIGGATKLHNSIESYDNLIPFIPSIIEMFGGPNIDFWISDWINSPNIRLNDDFLLELENHPMHTLPKEWFFPDGDHPNRKAHRKIFEFILNQHK